jgi:ABC-2 type transport system ATP-binding protein
MENILELNGVTKRYGDFSLQVDLSLKRGYIMGFLGPNGAGKSTTIRLIMGLVRKDGGRIRLFGLDLDTHEREIKERIGFVFDQNYFYEELTAEEMKNTIRPFYSRWDESLFRKYAKQFDLPLNKPIKQLSKGMKTKFSLAVALSHDAELLIMDEPTSGLDPLIRSEILDILQEIIQDENKSVFFSTHITSDLDQIADFITILHQGRVLLNSTKDELMERYCIVKGSRDKLDRMQQAGLIGYKENRYGFEGLARDRKAVYQLFGDSVVIEKPTLEDLMLHTIRGGKETACIG